MFTQLENAKQLLSIEYVSVVGLLLCACGYLIYINKQWKDELTEAKEELREKDKIIYDLMEKYYTIATKLSEQLDDFKDFYRNHKAL